MTNSEILLRASRGIRALRERQKQQVKEHVERIKRLDLIVAEIDKSDITQSSLVGMSALDLSPELLDLLENPTHGL